MALVKVAHIFQDQRTAPGPWLLHDMEHGKLVGSSTQLPFSVLAEINPLHGTIDLDPNYKVLQNRYPGQSNFNSNNVSRDAWTIPYGSSNLSGSPRLVRNILTALIKSKAIDPDWKVINSPEYRGQSVADILTEARPDPVDEVASRSTGSIILYHGTSEKRWKIIKVKGLKPGSPTGFSEEAYIDQVKGYSDHNIYLSSSIPEAEKYATRAAILDRSKAVVLSVVVNDFTRLRVDEDATGTLTIDGWTLQFGGHAYKVHDNGTVSMKNWQKEPGAGHIEDLFQQQMLKGFRKDKTVAYRGAILPTKLKVVETYKPVKIKNDPKYDHSTANPESFEDGMKKVRENMKYADLNPPLGGGPCRVVDRILRNVRDRRLRETMVDEVEGGHSLPNAEARKIYPFDKETGSAFKSFSITPHAQYRMDLRGITVKDVTQALDSFAARLVSVKGTPAFDWYTSQETITWKDPKSQLEIAFGLGDGEVNIITTYWKNRRDPPPTDCTPQRVASSYAGFCQWLSMRASITGR